MEALVADGVRVTAVARGEARLQALRAKLPAVQIIEADCDRIALIRDFRHVPYIGDEAGFVAAQHLLSSPP